MLCLGLFLFSIVTVLGTKTELDVISCAGWPVFNGFSQELKDNAVLVSVFSYFDGDDRVDRAVLHDGRNKTYLHGLYPWYNISSGPTNTRELVEISGLSVKDIQLVKKFIVILTDDGSVWTAGYNLYGSLSGDTINRPTFTRVLGVRTVRKIAVGYYNSVVLTDDGKLFSWGKAYKGNLGRSTQTLANPIPGTISLGQGASLPTSICCTCCACMALTEDAEVFTWGISYHIGRSGDNAVPGRVPGIPSGETIIKVACGFGHMVALTASGRLYGWGLCAYGELRQTPWTTVRRATELNLGEKVVRDVVPGYRITIVRTNADEVYYFGRYNGQDYRNPTRLNGNLYPRDLMARGLGGQWSSGAVSLECDNDEIAVTDETAGTTGFSWVRQRNRTGAPWVSGGKFNIKMSSYQYRKSHCGDKTVVRSSYLHSGISYTGTTWVTLPTTDMTTSTTGTTTSTTGTTTSTTGTTTSTTGTTTSTTGTTTSTTGTTTSTTDTTTSTTGTTTSTTDTTTSTTGLSADAAAGLTAGIMLIVLLVTVTVGAFLYCLKPVFMQRLRQRQEQDMEMPEANIYCDFIQEVPSKPLPMHELSSFLKLNRNIRNGCEAEYNEVIHHTTTRRPSNPGPTYGYEHLKDGRNIPRYTFEVYGSHRKQYMLLHGNQCDRKSLWEIVQQTGAENIVVFGDDLKRDLFNGGENGCEGTTVSTEYTEEFSAYIIQHMNITNEDVQRPVHVHFVLSWEKGSIPANAAACVDFRRKLRQRNSAAEIELVVCSGDLDRSGTFLAIDYSLNQAASENTVDVFRYCIHLLSKCSAMKLTKRQYEFVYDAVLEHWESRNSAAQVTQFCADAEKDTACSRNIFRKIDVLRQILPPDEHRDDTFPEKNRYPDIVPAEFARPILRTDMEEMGEYINAVYVNSYICQNAYIATQAPLNTTVHDIWRLIYDTGASTIVMLNKIDDERNVPRYWPLMSVTSLFGNLTVRLHEEHTETCGLTARLFSVTGAHGDERQVRQYQITNWSDHYDTPDSCDALLRILELVQQWTYEQGNAPIVVHCRNGAHKTGLYCAAMFIIDQLQASGVVDILHGIRRVQACRPQFISSQEQVAFLYRLVREFIESNQDYVNQW